MVSSVKGTGVGTQSGQYRKATGPEDEFGVVNKA